MRPLRWVLVTAVLLLGAGVGPAAPQQAANPHGALALPCAACHQAAAWKPARIGPEFDHGRWGFPLAGAHASAGCLSCHQSLDFRGVASSCASCHRDVHQGELGAACERCHQTRSFRDPADMFRAHQQSRFVLDGAHAAVECRECHTPAPGGSLVWRNRPASCRACHQADAGAARMPDHAAAGFTGDCAACHDRSGWSGGRFDHGTTAWPLTGAHVQAGCADCHATGQYRGRDQACVACHADDYTRAATPPHQSAGFPTDCTLCHGGATVWTGAQFDHAGTGFPLTGAHQAAACADCHADGVYAGKASTCVACHRTDYDRTVSPAHPAAGFSTDCAGCHTAVGWSGARFNHAATAFPLTGGHLAVACAQCHGDGVYRGKPTVCVSCHQADYDRVTVPNHRTLGFPTDCASCHGTAGWAGATFNHDLTRFALTGAHRAVSCAECHADGVYAGKPTACLACHQADYDGTAAPPHRSLGFSTECTSCHTTAAWPGARFDHAGTAFPLTGAHLAVNCAGCHRDNLWDGKPTACAACHQAAYDATTDPNHRTARFPTDCAACHTTAGWAGARFDHDAQYFPIYAGKHAGKWSACSSCHPNAASYAVFTCLSCHEHNQTSMDDKHKSMSGYRYDSQTCLSCHPRGTKP